MHTRTHPQNREHKNTLPNYLIWKYIRDCWNITLGEWQIPMIRFFRMCSSREHHKKSTQKLFSMDPKTQHIFNYISHVYLNVVKFTKVRLKRFEMKNTDKNKSTEKYTTNSVCLFLSWSAKWNSNISKSIFNDMCGKYIYEKFSTEVVTKVNKIFTWFLTF